MRILDRYVCREVFSHAMLGLAVFTFVFFVPQLVRLMELVVRHGSTDRTLLFGCSLISVLPYTLPMAALVGVLIGLGRLSADSEIVAMNALGIGLRRLLIPIGLLACGFALITLIITFWLGPVALRTLHLLVERLGSSQASYEVLPRVFDERFPRIVLYVQDVDATATHWRGVFIADSNGATGSHVTLAESAIVIADPHEDKLELHFGNGSTHGYDPRQPDHYDFTKFGASDQTVELNDPSKSAAVQLKDSERSMMQLLEVQGSAWRDARVEFHRRLAFPAACLVFALLGVPVGVRPRRGGRAAGFILTLLLICGYYLIFVTGVHMAQQGSVAPSLGVWAANFFTFLAALVLLRRIEHVRGQSALSRWIDVLVTWRRTPKEAVATALPNGPLPAPTRQPDEVRAKSRMGGFPLLIDLYVLRTFLYYFALLLVGFIVLFDAFTLFDLLEDISKNHISVWVVANYFRYLIPLMFYQLVPLAALVSTLVTLGVLAKNNEITAFKASGVSLYRLALPLLLAGAILAGSLFVLDDTYLPYATQRQDALRNQIKGKPAQTFYQPAHQWILGENNKVFNYELFDADRNLFGGLSVFELDPITFQIRRRVFASRAEWVPNLNTWVLEGGWVRDFNQGKVNYKPFQISSLEEIAEPPSYFKREVRQSFQMNWRQLRAYIEGLQQAGFDTARLSVQWHKKFAFPLIVPIIIFLGVPFAFLVGTRGAVGGLAVAIGIGIVYWATAALFEAMGGVGQLPALLAGWAPDAIFGFLGAYFFLKMPT
jgi:LPS export ABC transporter permease LptF/LPS export ABC transporter permease LptG